MKSELVRKECKLVIFKTIGYSGFEATHKFLNFTGPKELS
jgi:hypothetical protein